MRLIALIAVGLILAGLGMQGVLRGDGAAAAAPAVRGDAPPATSQPATVTLTGTFNWNAKGAKQFPLTAVLTRTAANAWTAVYTFNWDNKPTTFTGTAKADPATSEFSGAAKTANGGRTFAFKGTSKDGVVAFKHFETTGGKSNPTGSGTLKQGS
jgi:hypothetical protein